MTDDDLMEICSPAEKCDLKMLRICQEIVQSKQSNIAVSSTLLTQVAKTALASRRRRSDSYNRSQRNYAKRKKLAQKKEAERENRLLLSEHRYEKLMTSIANESRKITSLLCGLVAVQLNLSQTQRDALVAMTSPESVILDPATPQLVIISDDDSFYKKRRRYP